MAYINTQTINKSATGQPFKIFKKKSFCDALRTSRKIKIFAKLKTKILFEMSSVQTNSKTTG